MMLNILFIGQFEPGNLELIYFNAFNEIEGINAFKFDIRGESKTIQNKSSLNRILYNRFTYNFFAHQAFNRVRNYLEQKINFYDAIIIFKGMEFSPDDLKILREKQRNAVWININPDNPFNTESIASTNQNVISSIGFFDIYCIWSKDLVEQLNKYSANKVIYLPFAFDNTYHHPPKKPVKISKDQVIFIGAWDKEREELLNKISNFNLMVCGAGWDRISRNSLKGKRIFSYNIYLEDLSEAVYSSAVSLNILRSQNSGSHNMRTFEIPAMNGLMLTSRTSEQDLFFQENKACYMFESVDELKDKIIHILKNPNKAIEVRGAGHYLVQNHTYLNRALYLFENIMLIINQKNHLIR